MFAAIIFTVAIAAMGQFGLYYWRAVVAGVALQPVSDRVMEAAHVEPATLCGRDFERFVGLFELTPELTGNKSGLKTITAYYHLLGGVKGLLGKAMPALALWSEREQVLCARYAAVQIDRRIEHNLTQAAAIRSC